MKKAASAVKKHVVDPVKEHVVDPIAGGVFRHFVKTFNRLFREKMPEDACTKKSAADSNIAGFEQDVMLQQPSWSLKRSAAGSEMLAERFVLSREPQTPAAMAPLAHPQSSCSQKCELHVGLLEEGGVSLEGTGKPCSSEQGLCLHEE